MTLLARSILALTLLLLTFVGGAQAQSTYTWGGSSGGSWRNATGWSGGPNSFPGLSGGGTGNGTTTDIASFITPNSASYTVGLNFGTGSNGLFGTLGLGAVTYSGNTAAAASVLTLGNNSGSDGLLTLNGATVNSVANTLLSNTTTNATTLRLNPNVSGTNLMGVVLGINNGIITASTGNTISIGSVISDGGNARGFTKTGTGTLTLSGANTFTGGVTHNAGTLALGNNAALGTGTLSVAAVGTTVSVVGTTSTFANNVSLVNAAGRVTFVTQNNSSTTLNGIISGGAASTSTTAVTGTEWFFQGGAGGQNTGFLTLNGNNSGWQGTLNIQRGPLVLGNANAAGSTLIWIDSNNNPAGSLQFDGNFTIANNVRLQSGSNPIGVGSSLVAGISGVINSNTNIGFNKVGTGTLVLSGANTYTGLTTISAGTLQIGAGGTSGTLGTAGVTNNAVLAFNRSDALSVSNIVSGTGAVNQIGAGTTTLTAANTFTGALNINNGTVALGIGGSIATNTINVASGGVFDSSLAGGYTQGASGVLTVGRSGTAANDVVGDFTAAGGINIGGAGNFRTATFANNFTLNSATLAFDLGTSLTAGGGFNDYVSILGNLTLNGTSTLNITQPGGGLTTGSYTLFTYGGTLTGSAANLTIGGAASGTTRQAFTIDTTTLANNVLLNVTGSPANLTWTGTNNSNWDLVTTANNFSGATDNRFFNLDTVNFTDSSSVGAVTLTGSLSPTAVNVNNSSTNYVFSGTGSITGNTGLTKSGTANLTIATDNTYTGGTTISAGVLQLGNGGTTGSVTGAITNNATLAVNRSDSYTLANLVNGTGGLTQAGTGTTILTAANTYSGTTLISTGTLQVGNAGTTGSLGTGDVTNNAVLAFNRSNAQTVANNISGTGSVTKAGAGTLTLGGTNTFSGGFTQTAGAVTITNGSALGTGTYTIGSGAAAGATGTIGSATLSVNNTAAVTLANNVVIPAPGAATTYSVLKASGGVLDFTGVLSGGGANTTLYFNSNTSGDSTTIYRLSGANTFTAANININRGVLQVNNVSALGAGTNRVTLDSNVNNTIGNLSFNVSGSFANPVTISAASAYPIGVTAGNTVTLTNTITSASNFTKVDAGTLILTGNNSYTTQTLVNAGTLNVNGDQSAATGATTVASGATLGGTGTIGGTVSVASGGTLAPSTGTLTVNNNVTIGAGGNLSVALPNGSPSGTPGGSGNASGFLNVASGTFTFDSAANLLIDGSALSITPNASYTFKLAQVNTQDLSGLNITDQARFVATGFQGDNFALVGDATGAVYLTFVAVPEPALLLVFGALGIGLAAARKRVQR